MERTTGNRPAASATPGTARTVADKRREIAAKGPEAFAQVYLPHLLVAQNDVWDKDAEKHDDAKVIIEEGQTIPASEFHRDLYDRFDTPRAMKRREAFVAPRGFAKSTVVTILVLYMAAFKLRDFVVWTSETASQVEELVASIIDELEGNLTMLGDFPEMKPAKDERGQYVKFNDRDIVLKSGFRLSARGAQKATRGLRRGAKRPDLFICDDSEGEATTGETQYPKIRRWLTRVIAPALAPGGDILWVGTLIDWVSVTGALIRKDEDWTQGWSVTHMQAEWYTDPEGRKVDSQSRTYIDNGDPLPDEFEGKLEHHLLWPEYWPQARLDAFLEENGSLAYSFEMLNKPMSDGDKVFQDRDWLKFAEIKNGFIYRDGFERTEWINERLLRHVTFIDPSFGGKDYSAIVTVGIFAQDIFVREAVWMRGEGVRTSQVEEAVRQAEHWNSAVIGVEKVAAQILVADETVTKTRIPVEPVSPGAKSKEDRALPVAIRASQSHIYFESGNPGVRALRELLLKFPGPDIDDPVDAFVYAVELAASVKNRTLQVS
jgi:hypothetical protein